jgi:hypothetical protein
MTRSGAARIRRSESRSSVILYRWFTFVSLAAFIAMCLAAIARHLIVLNAIAADFQLFLGWRRRGDREVFDQIYVYELVAAVASENGH